MSDFRVLRLGTVPYLDAWALQKQLADARGRDAIPDTLVLVEHPHVYTLGSAGQESNLLWTEEERRANHVDVHRVDRGGNVTYHGPGQLVGYPILKLPRSVDGLHADVVAYIRNLEQVLIRALGHYGLQAFPYPGLTGVWVNDPPAKIAAIGVKVTTKAVTLHGFALNVNPEMRYFGGIVPCGISDKPVTSLAAQLGTAPSMTEVMEVVTSAFGEALNRTPIRSDIPPTW
jgi:lipoate-protein ligase B